MRELRLHDQGDRVKRSHSAEPAVATPDAKAARGRFPSEAATTKADTTLQRNLVEWLTTDLVKKKHLPPNASITPFIERYDAAVRAPALQAWLKSKGLRPETVRVQGDSVTGTAVQHGKHTFQRFTITDGSGWGQVSAGVSALQKILSPNDLGLPIATGKDQVEIPRNVQLDFYGVKPPVNEKAAPHLGKLLKHEGWPAISQAQREQWQAQFKQQKRGQADSTVRERLSEQLKPLVGGQGEDDTLSLDEQTVTIEPGSTLDVRSKKPRERFLEFLADPAFQALLNKTGFGGPGTEYRLSEGDLQKRYGTGLWISLQHAFNDEVQKASSAGTAAEQAAARRLNADFGQLVEMSKETGNTLYSTRTYDARQVLAFYTLDVPQTAEQLRAALGWLDTQLPAPPFAGNYASMTPYGQDQGVLSATAIETLKGVSGLVVDLLKGATSAVPGSPSNPDPDHQLAAVFDSPGAIVLSEKIAKTLKLFAVADGQALSRADRHQLLATALKLSVDTPVPGLAGTVAGYELYQPANMGRTLKEVRADVEKQLEGKGVDPNISALMAHLYLAQSAPEMLIKRDPAVPVETAKLVNQDPENIKVGSTGWLNMRLASAIAGDSRLTLQQAWAVARRGAAGPNQESLVSALGSQALLDWGVMAGIYPATSDRQYSNGDYAAASKAFTERETQTNEAFNTMAVSPTQTSILVKQLARLFPEMTEDEIRNLKIDYPNFHVSRNVGVRQAPNKNSPALLTDVILMNQHAGKPALGEKESWTNSAFIHGQVSIATFRERLKQLPNIKSLVESTVDSHITDVQAAQATALKRVFAELPLKQRMALESSKEIQFFTLRKGTGDDLEADKSAASKVAESRGTHGLLMRYETGEAKPKYGYYEVFPNSFTMVERTDLPDDLMLGGEIAKGQKPFGPFAYVSAQFRKGTALPFDFEAYSSGAAPRAGVKSEVIIEKLGEPLKGAMPSAYQRIPNTFASAKVSQIVKTLNAYSFKGDREARIEHANEQSALLKRTYPTAPGAKLFTAENARGLLSLIPFVGAIADLVEGKTEDGLKGLLIDLASFVATGGLPALKHFASGLKLLLRFNGKPFSTAALKGAGTFLRGLLNPVENVPGIFRAGPNTWKAFKAIGTRPLHVGSNVYLPVTAFEQWRWTRGAFDTFASGSNPAASQSLGARKGASNGREVDAVQKNGFWYAVNASSGRPEGSPLEHFEPQPS